MKLFPKYRPGIALLALSGLLGACSDATPGETSETIETTSAALGGVAEVVNDPAPDDPSAAVAMIVGGATPCSGTFVTRSTVVTAASCVLEYDNWEGAWIPADPADLQVAFDVADVGTDAALTVTSVVPLASTGSAIERGIAVLHLAEEVPATRVAELTPVYLRSVDELLNTGSEPFVAGYGCTTGSSTCPDGRVLRRGPIRSELDLVESGAGAVPHRIVADLDPALDAIPYRLDIGGPLFVYDPASKRYVIAGVATGTASQPGQWTYLGHGLFIDHASAIRAELGPDDDGDGMPDVVDNCAPSACVAAGFPAVECANGSQRSTAGGMGDACCFADSRYANDRNSNPEAESDLSARAVPDFCDPVPLFRFQTDPTLADEQFGSMEEIGIRGETWLGAFSDWNQQGYDNVFADRIGFRFCDCVDGPDAYEQEYCEANLCSAGGAVDGLGGFVEVEVVDQDSGLPVSSPFFPSQPFVAGQAGTQKKLVWDWRQSYDTGVIDGLEVEINGTAVSATAGFLASAALKDGRFASKRDATALGRLRADLSFESVPDRSDVPVSFDRLIIDWEEIAICLFGCDRAILFPWDDYIRHVFDYRDIVNDPMQVIVDPALDQPYAVASWDHLYRMDLATVLTDTTAWTFPEASAPWRSFAAVESIASLRGMSVDSRSVLLAPAGTGSIRAFRVFADPSGLHVDGAGNGWQAGNGTAAAQLVQVPTAGRAVYSATRGKVLLVGGSELPAASRIRAYDVEAGTLATVEVETELAPSALVLGAAFDHVANRLYVLDAAGETARLIAHDLDAGNSRLLWSTTYANTYDSVFLGTDEKQQLVLAVTDGASYTAWSIDVRGPLARFTGRLDGEGMPINTPMMGAYVLEMPVATAGSVRSVKLSAAHFRKGVACSGL